MPDWRRTPSLWAMLLTLLLALILALNWSGIAFSQVRPSVSFVGGDDVPQLKAQFEKTLEIILLEMNRIGKGTGSRDAVAGYFTPDAFAIFEQYVLQNKAYTARRTYTPMMITRQRGQAFDVRSIHVKIDPGETEASDMQELVFTFARDGKVISVRSVLPNYDYQSLIRSGSSAIDSTTRAVIVDFLERLRIAYNTKDSPFLERVYSDDALIIVGTVLKPTEKKDDYMRGSFLSTPKVKLIEMKKRDYLDGLKRNAFRKNSFVNVRFDSLEIIQHEKVPFIYGISCRQEWRSSTYSDSGFLFLMMDFRDEDEPMIHVRAWQPQPFEDGSVVNLYHFNVAHYH